MHRHRTQFATILFFRLKLVASIGFFSVICYRHNLKIIDAEKIIREISRQSLLYGMHIPLKSTSLNLLSCFTKKKLNDNSTTIGAFIHKSQAFDKAPYISLPIA